MKFEKAYEILTRDPVAAANDAVRVYKKYLGTKALIWTTTLFVVTLIKKLAEPDSPTIK